MLVFLFDISVALVLVLTFRRLARRLFGAGPAFMLWLLPPLFILLPLLPVSSPSWSLSPALIVMPLSQSLTRQAIGSTVYLSWLWLAWGAGTLACLSRLAMSYRQLQLQIRPVPESMWQELQPLVSGIAHHRVRLHTDGPAVFWSQGAFLLLPVDFMHRFNATERRLILRHERTHMRRGDPLWTLLATTTCALLWFHPLVWLSLSRFRLDQELACDESVLRQSPHDEIAYAHTLLQSTGHRTSPVLIPWLDPPQLKERLKMIERKRTSSLRRRLGYPALLAAIAACAVSVQAGPLTHAPSGTSTDLSDNLRTLPRYPKSSIEQKEQGLVMLKVLVDPQGSVKSVDYEPHGSTTTSASLIGAASDAVFKWHFNPAMKSGKPIESYARVPVKFDLDKLPENPPGKHATANSTNL